MSKSLNKSDANLTIVERRFTDIDELAEVLSSRRNIQLVRLTAQKFECNLAFTEFNQAQFFFADSIGSVRCKGEKSLDDLAFSCILRSGEGQIIAHGHPISNDTLFGFDVNRDINQVYPSNLEFCTVLIKRRVFDDCLEVMGREDIDQQFLSGNFLHSPTTVLAIKSYLFQLRHLIKNQPQLLTQSHLEKLIIEDFIPLLIGSIPQVKADAIRALPSLARVRMVQEAEDYIMANLTQPLTIKQLCKALNLSRRPLFYGFEEMFGIGPMAYLKIQRLHAVRRTLKAADPETSSVGAIAQQFGFWSAGHFSRDYKKMFGELPSKTLKR